MATTLARQPFAPLDGARLQTLTSLKNRQNAITTSGGKRKADSLDGEDNSENVDPGLFSKRSKGTDGFPALKDCFKPSAFVLTQAASNVSPIPKAPGAFSSAPSTIRAAAASPRRRVIATPKSPAARINTALAAAAPPLSAPAGRSPTRGSKRIGLLNNRRRTANGSPFARVDPPVFGLSAGAPFSLDAALKGTISSYASRNAASAAAAPAAASSSSLLGGGGNDLYGSSSEIDSSWVFDIHEDTPEQEMTNLLQHGTNVLDISSDEESELKARRERAEGRDKENIPPADDVSQTTSASSRAIAAAAARRAGGEDENEMVIEKSRGPLAEMNAADYYAIGCDSESVIIVPGEYEYETEDAETVVGEEEEEEDGAVLTLAPAAIVDDSFEFAPELKNLDSSASRVDEIMGCRDEPARKAALLQPIEGTGESFELWESGSAKDEAEQPSAPPSPCPAAAEEVVSALTASTAAIC